MRDEVDHGLEGLVSGETDGDFPFSRRNQERFSRSVKLSHMAEEETVNEYRRPDRLNVQLDFRGVFPVWVLDLEVLCHVIDRTRRFPQEADQRGKLNTAYLPFLRLVAVYLATARPKYSKNVPGFDVTTAMLDRM